MVPRMKRNFHESTRIRKFREWNEYGLLKSNEISEIQHELEILVKNNILIIDSSKYEKINVNRKELDRQKSLNYSDNKTQDTPGN